MSMGGNPNDARLPTGSLTPLAMIVGLALVVRLAIVAVLSPTPLTGDEIDYWQRARALATDGTLLRLGGRPPMMDFFLAGVMAVAGISLVAARVALAVVGALAVLPAFALGRRVGDIRVAHGAALAVALYPNLIFFSASLWSETLYNVLALGATVLLLSSVPDRRGAIVRAGAAGALLAGAALTRTVAPLFALSALGWLGWQVRDMRGRGLAVAASAAVVFFTLFGAWYLFRSSQVAHGTLAGGPVWINLYVGNVVHPNDDHFEQYRKLDRDPVVREQIARDRTLEAIRDRLPWWPLEKLVSESQAYWSANSIPVMRLNAAPHGTSPYSLWAYVFTWPPANEPGLRMALVVVIAAIYAAAALLGTAGLTLYPAGRAWTLCCLFIATHFAPAIVSFGMPRFRLSSMVLLLVFGAWAAFEGPSAWARASRHRRVLTIAATATLAATIAAGLSNLFFFSVR